MNIETVKPEYRELILKAATEVVDLRGADLSGTNLSWADLRGADLSGTNLSWADLRGADLSGTNLSGTNLSWADLSGTNLSGTNLSWADLRGADLRGANLSDADLRGANLSGTNLRGANLKVYQAGEWISYITPSHIRIGCQFHETKKWREFSDSEIDAMNRNALAYWKENKAIVLSIAESFVEQEKKFS